MKTSIFLALGLCGALTLGSARAGDENTSDNSSGLQNIPAQSFAPSSAGVDDVIKLAKSGVGDPVVISYIKQSQVAYQPNAQEIIKMKDEGVSSQVITAVIDRGGEVRSQETSATQTGASTATTAQPAPPPQTTTVYTYAQPDPVYVDATPNVIVIGRGYPTYPFASIGWGRPYCYSGFYYGGGFRGGWGGSRFVAIGHNGGGFRASSHAGFHHR